ncbi:hypothetical protein OC846_003713 [Tilletia horrida]|uniref:Uncharacterized protein n=1 Tax=Tilletia horrida TaxID=155126 RepID=A0AAN6GNZ1_9BASI|nr:hypothetical protein OC846_003713 [Tilletia horrida]KAK0565453.1 hypothetical protein OC861_003751 [Tilletia horrida]
MSLAVLEEVLTAAASVPLGLSLLSRYTPSAISSSSYYVAIHRIQTTLTLFLNLLLSTSSLSLEHALYLKLSLKPKDHQRQVHSLVVVTSVPRGALKVQQTILTLSFLAWTAQAWLSQRSSASSGTTALPALARALLAHLSLIVSAAVTLITLPLDGPSLRVNYLVTGLEALDQQSPETTGTTFSDERLNFAPIDIILPLLPDRRADGSVIQQDKTAPSPAAAAALKAASAQAGQEAPVPDAYGWLKVANTNKKRDVYVRKTPAGKGRGWQIKTEMADDHPLKSKSS